MIIKEVITVQAADTRSMLLWFGSLVDSLSKVKTENPDQETLREILLEKTKTVEADLLALASFTSDVVAAIDDNVLMEDLIFDIKAEVD